MSAFDAIASRNKWNQRHGGRELGTPACEVLQTHLSLLPAQGRALDLACGLGRNAILLAQHGLQCDAMDISDVALARLASYANEHNLSINTLCTDIERDGIGDQQYDVIVVSYFLYRPLLNAINLALKLGGLLFYQTFVRSASATNLNKAQTKLGNPDFYLAENELQAQFNDLEIRYYHETVPDQLSDTAAVAMLVASKTTPH
ncbi:MAG: SAM-dependent methyltransferase [Zhongshania sp.]|jgi:tellurite methyltransferase|nr:class I SAM-dependent methyltransferase [Zhongshania sp.]